MAKGLKLNLPPADDLFSTQEERDHAKSEKVMEISLSEIDDFPNHPFRVAIDDEMCEMAESIKQYGVLVPCLVRPKEDGRYEIVAGHRRKAASELAERDTMPCIIRDLTDDEATIIMVDSNLQREKILPSEKAKAYKMRLDAMKRQAGRPSKENHVPVGHNFEGKSSRELLSAQTPDSNTQIQRYIRLNNLIPQLLDMVDNAAVKEKGKQQIAMRPAVELSYLSAEHQQWLAELIACDECTPSHVQAMKMRKFADEGRLNEDVIFAVMQEEKPNQADYFKMPREKINKFFAIDTPVEKIADTIVKALELWRSRERNRDNSR